MDDLDQTTWDLSVKNPNAKQEDELRDPKEIIAEIIALDKESEAILAKIQELVWWLGPERSLAMCLLWNMESR